MALAHLSSGSSGVALAQQRQRAVAGPSRTALCPRRLAGTSGKTSFSGRTLANAPDNGSMRWRTMATWLENKASIDVDVPLEPCWALWEDREKIPTWMPWIKSVKVLDNDPRLSRWTLSTHQFGRDWEFSWLARNLPPVKGNKIHWVSERGSASLGIEVQNRGQIKFKKLSPTSTHITLIISYEVPDVLVPFANALTPLVEGIIGQDMVRFKDYVTEQQRAKVSSSAA
ncbi:hypothetical protein HYH03_011046 [Edaphochlamys debaryana]|uniref:Coenzyme Q-binding protein COQ10 START domain-containing protein n=1 Tax=Edaphochlamys debaryana TaxID=47281 RepID=A0A835XX69_9CHLO|nr:hypothetical protein HYH03_011046 [Edaphochlamys debaryana]|eukprot:KAG2490658.1 hypothetical protein HYH03_011046 [Edaphochlamys debaryana]